jgi:hypothetical protein
MDHIPLLKTSMNTELKKERGASRQMPRSHLSQFFIGLSIEAERDISLSRDEMPYLVASPVGSRSTHHQFHKSLHEISDEIVPEILQQNCVLSGSALVSRAGDVVPTSRTLLPASSKVKSRR